MWWLDKVREGKEDIKVGGWCYLLIRTQGESGLQGCFECMKFEVQRQPPWELMGAQSEHSGTRGYVNCPGSMKNIRQGRNRGGNQESGGIEVQQRECFWVVQWSKQKDGWALRRMDLKLFGLGIPDFSWEQFTWMMETAECQSRGWCYMMLLRNSVTERGSK